MLIDTHTHLDRSRQLVDAQLAEAEACDVRLMVQSGTDLKSSRTAVSMAEVHPGVFATVGIHPHNAAATTSQDIAGLRDLARNPKVVGVGETGLDFYRNRSPWADQERVFLAQIELARQLDLPLVIHTRDADARSVPLLREHAAGLNVILHCFSMPDRVEEFAELGWYMSFAGNVTYKKSVELQEAARKVPAELILVETDAPYLTPVPLRGRPNTSAYVVHTYRFLAELRHTTVVKLAELVLDNAATAFPRLQVDAI